MKKKGIAGLGAGVLIILTILVLLFFRNPSEPEKLEKVRAGIFADSICSLVYIAQQQGFFKRQGLDVTIENYPAGVYAVDDLLEGKCDLAVAAEFVLAVQAFKRPDLRTIGTISSTDSLEVVVRRDRGIEKPGDLKGKVLGVSKRTVNDFFLSVFLPMNNLRPEEVRTIDLKPDEIITALSEGKIDGAINFRIYVNEIKKRLGDKVLSWPAQGGQDFYFLLFVKEEMVKTHPRAVSGLLKGLLEAETFLKEHGKEGQDIMKKILALDQEGLLSTWSKTHFRVSLNKNLLTLMEDEGRWAIRNNVVDARRIPDYSTFLYPEGLKKIKPEAVDIGE
jgi:NitT/TauT family transport system substrate-binding protein